MNEKNTKYLTEKYLNLYDKISNFECGDGWFALVDGLSEKLEALIIEYKAKLPCAEVDPVCTQVKEKYGQLRFYMNLETEEMSDAIAVAEKKSRVTCELCGKPGSIRGKYWLTNFCDDCWTRNH